MLFGQHRVWDSNFISTSIQYLLLVPLLADAGRFRKTWTRQLIPEGPTGLKHAEQRQERTLLSPVTSTGLSVSFHTSVYLINSSHSTSKCTSKPDFSSSIIIKCVRSPAVQKKPTGLSLMAQYQLLRSSNPLNFDIKISWKKNIYSKHNTTLASNSLQLLNLSLHICSITLLGCH